MTVHHAVRALITAWLGISWSLGDLAAAGDWPQWRGPNRDGISAEKDWTTRWPEKGPKVLWKAKVYTGMSSVAVVGARLYTMGFLTDKPGPDGKHQKDEEGRRMGTDFVWCLDAGTGAEVWKHSYPAPGDETYSTPTVHDGLVYTLGRFGRLFCFDAASGHVLWSKNLVSDFAGLRPYYGYACSPLALGDVLVVVCGGPEALVRGLDRKTGRPLWKCGKGPAGFSSPIAYEAHGRPAVVVLTPSVALAVNPGNGEELWKIPWRMESSACATPIISGDKIFLSGAGHQLMNRLLQLTPGEPKVVWQNEEMNNYFQSSVLIDGHLYGTHAPDHVSKNASLRCVRFGTGEVAWRQDGLGHAPLMAADGKLIIMDEKGDLVVAEASPKGFKELARTKVLDGHCWACPVLCRGRIYCRSNGGEMVCLDVSGGR